MLCCSLVDTTDDKESSPFDQPVPSFQEFCGEVYYAHEDDPYDFPAASLQDEKMLGGEFKFPGNNSCRVYLDEVEAMIQATITKYYKELDFLIAQLRTPSVTAEFSSSLMFATTLAADKTPDKSNEVPMPLEDSNINQLDPTMATQTACHPTKMPSAPCSGLFGPTIQSCCTQDALLKHSPPAPIYLCPSEQMTPSFGPTVMTTSSCFSFWSPMAINGVALRESCGTLP